MIRNIILVVAIGFVVGCASAEVLEGDALAARLSGQQITLSDDNEVTIVAFGADGTGTFTEVKKSGRTEQGAVMWSVRANTLCLNPDGSGTVSSSGLEECIALSFAGSTVMMMGGRDESLTGIIGPIQP